MKPRPWRVSRDQIELVNATQRWDHAYQALLTWTADVLTQPATTTTPNHDAQEAPDAHCSICAGLDPTPSAEPGS